MLTWYKQLIALRKEHPELTNGSLEDTKVEYSEEKKLLVMRRGDLEVIVNLGNQPLTRKMPTLSKLLLSSNAEAKADQTSLTLPPDTVAIQKVK